MIPPEVVLPPSGRKIKNRVILFFSCDISDFPTDSQTSFLLTLHCINNIINTISYVKIGLRCLL